MLEFGSKHDHGKYCQSVLDSLNQQRLQGIFCDVQLVCRNSMVFNAHKCVLAAGSPKLSSYLQDKNCVQITFPDHTDNTVSAMLEILYTGILYDQSHNSLISLQDLAEKLDLSQILQLCSKSLNDGSSKPVGVSDVFESVQSISYKEQRTPDNPIAPLTHSVIGVTADKQVISKLQGHDVEQCTNKTLPQSVQPVVIVPVHFAEEHEKLLDENGTNSQYHLKLQCRKEVMNTQPDHVLNSSGLLCDTSKQAKHLGEGELHPSAWHTPLLAYAGEKDQREEVADTDTEPKDESPGNCADHNMQAKTKVANLQLDAAQDPVIKKDTDTKGEVKCTSGSILSSTSNGSKTNRKNVQKKRPAYRHTKHAFNICPYSNVKRSKSSRNNIQRKMSSHGHIESNLSPQKLKTDNVARQERHKRDICIHDNEYYTVSQESVDRSEVLCTFSKITTALLKAKEKSSLEDKQDISDSFTDDGTSDSDAELLVFEGDAGDSPEAMHKLQMAVNKTFQDILQEINEFKSSKGQISQDSNPGSTEVEDKEDQAVASEDVIKDWKACKYCSKFKGRKKGSLEFHQQYCSSHFMCKLCNKPFLTEADLSKHHCTKMDQCFCDICGKILVSRAALRLHKNVVHLRLKNKICDHCGKTFARAHQLKAHIAHVHSRDRPHVCEKCGMAFALRYELNTHMKQHSEHNKFMCEQCGTGFKEQRRLSRHVKNMHMRRDNKSIAKRKDTVTNAALTDGCVPAKQANSATMGTKSIHINVVRDPVGGSTSTTLQEVEIISAINNITNAISNSSILEQPMDASCSEGQVVYQTILPAEYQYQLVYQPQ